MNFRIKFICFILLVFSAVFAFAQTSLDQAIENGHRYLSGRLPKGTRAAIMPIKAENPELGDYISKKVSLFLVNAGWFTVVERNQAALDSLNKEMNYQMSGYVSEETELSIGKQLGAELIISGSFAGSGQNWKLDLQALRV